MGMYLVDGDKRLLEGTCSKCKRYHKVPIGALCTHVPPPQPTFTGPGLDEVISPFVHRG